MTGSVELAIKRWWSGPRGPAGRALHAAARPAELAFRGAVALRGRAYDAGWLASHRVAVPVVCVGNLTVGGTGKTPLAGWIVGTLQDAGLRPAVVARGYGQDEAALHTRWHPAARVFTDVDRVAAVRAAAADGADVVVADDGFQHRQLARDLDVVVVSAEQPFPGALLPRGPFREPARALERADWVVVTRRTADVGDAILIEHAVRRAAPSVRTARARLAPAGWSALDGCPVPAPARPVLAVAAIAEPEAFARMVARETGATPELSAWPDHHEFTLADARRLARLADGRPLVTTEKDAVKLTRFADALPDVHVLRLEVRLESGGEELRASLLDVVRRSAKGDR